MYSGSKYIQKAVLTVFFEYVGEISKFKKNNENMKI